MENTEYYKGIWSIFGFKTPQEHYLCKLGSLNKSEMTLEEIAQFLNNKEQITKETEKANRRQWLGYIPIIGIFTGISKMTKMAKNGKKV